MATVSKIRSGLLAALAFIVIPASCSRVAVDTYVDTESDDVAVPADAEPGILVVKLDPLSMPSDGSAPDLSAFGDCTVDRLFPDNLKFRNRIHESGLDRWYTVCFDESLALTKAAGSVAAIPGVEKVEFLTDARIADEPFNDPQLTAQWHYDYNSLSGAVEGSGINLFKAWKVTTGSPDVIVAVIDEGVQYDHEDLSDNMWVNETELNGETGIDDDGNGFVDDKYGYNFVVVNNTTAGSLWPGDHGTHIAGTIAAVNGNGKGVCGIAGGNGTSGSGVKIMSAQTSDPSGKYTSAYISRAFTYAADNGAVLANCSWYLPSAKSQTPSYMTEAMDYFNKYAGIDEDGNQSGPMAGGLILFAAGNQTSSSLIYPPADDNVLAVASTGGDGEISYFSNYGSWVDITAPGGDSKKKFYIVSTLNGGKYGTMQGTSMSTPHVTGVAALVLSEFGGKGMTRDRLIRILQRTASDKLYEFNPGYIGYLGSGLVDAYAAVTCTGFNAPLQVTDLTGTSGRGYVDLTWTVPQDGTGDRPFCFNVYQTAGKTIGDSYGKPLGTVKTGDTEGGATLSLHLEGLNAGENYSFRVASENIYGTESTLSPEFTIKMRDNAPPVITPAGGTSITLKSHESGSLVFDISDEDEEEMTCSLEGDLPGLSMSREDDRITLKINALQAEDGKSYKGTLVVSDPHCSTTLDFTYTVEANHAPALAGKIDNIVLSSLQATASVAISGIFSDADGESLAYSVSNSDTKTLSASVTGTTSSLSLSLKASSYGTADIVVTASDARKASASASFSVLVRDGSEFADIYPNPASDHVFVRTGTDTSASVRIISKSGATVFSAVNVAVGPFNPYRVDLSGIAAGEYTLIAGSAKYAIVKK